MDKDAELVRLTGVDPEILAGIRELRLMDDAYFTCFFDNFTAGMELILQIILDKPDIRVKQSVTQRTAPNLYGRSARFDVLAVDSSGKIYDCEVQRAPEGAVPRRARLNSSLMDQREAAKGTDYKDLPETYVIFITETDVFHKGNSLYSIHRTFDDTGERFDDGTHIVYVNGTCQDNTKLGKLMQDFFARDPKRMNYPLLADRAEFFKDKPKGVSEMGEVLTGIVKKKMEEASQARAERMASRLLDTGMPLEEVAHITELTVEEVKKINRKRPA